MALYRRLLGYVTVASEPGSGERFKVVDVDTIRRQQSGGSETPFLSTPRPNPSLPPHFSDTRPRSRLSAPKATG